MILQTCSGTMALTMWIQTRASRLPSTSIALAAFSTIRRMASISIRARLTISRLPPSWMIGLPNATRGHAAGDHQVQRLLGRADGAHAVVDAARAQAQLANLEAAALAQQHVLRRHAGVVEADVHVAVRRVGIAEHLLAADDLAPRAVERHQDLRLLQVRRRVGARS